MALSDATLAQQIETISGYRFVDEALLAQAFTHTSASSTEAESNERLEFLGDAILGFVACEYLFRTLSHLPEGELTKVKSLVVSREVCAQITKELGLETFLLLGRGMDPRTLPVSVSAAIFESLIGAMYLDGGMEPAARFIQKHLMGLIVKACKAGHHRNFKSVLQEATHARGEGNPCYLLIAEQGPDHEKVFEVAITLGTRRFGSRWAKSKKAAEQAAAEYALREFGLLVDGPDGEPEVDWTKLYGVSDDTTESTTDSIDPDASTRTDDRVA
ncbi:MAG: ribonuclease III [Planctomycetota bacterium]|nr:ribonuclease III [Planctomycetota bacterium]